MRQFSKLKAVFLVAAVVVAMVAAVCICPFGLMANAQMATMMDRDMGAQTTDGMCPMLCGALRTLLALNRMALSSGCVPFTPS